jgi:glycosyltransferase involved in cell wall biosynthesis
MAEALYSIVVPVYKSEGSLRELYDRIDKTFENIDGDYELILVEDCGGDNSWQVMKSLREANNKVKIIKLTKNFPAGMLSPWTMIYRIPPRTFPDS